MSINDKTISLHPEINQVFILNKLDYFPISWLYLHSFCEYQIYLKNFIKVDSPPTVTMVKGTKMHKKLDDDFHEIATKIPSVEVEIFKSLEERKQLRTREFSLVDFENRIYGKIDEVVVTPNKIRIIDDKLGTKYEPFKEQLWGYCLAFRNTFNPKIPIYGELRHISSNKILYSEEFSYKEKVHVERSIQLIHKLIEGNKKFGTTFESRNCNVCRYNRHCDRIKVYAIKKKTRKKLSDQGILTLEDYSKIDPKTLSNLTGINKDTLESLKVKANAMITKKPYVIESLKLPKFNNNPIFIDIETNRSWDFIWLIGIHLSKKKIKQFISFNAKDERKNLRKFIELLEKESDRPVYYYAGTGFDQRILLQRCRAHGISGKLLSDMVDLCPRIKRSIILPIINYKLKGVGDYFCYPFALKDLDGDIVATIFESRFLKKSDELDLLEYLLGGKFKNFSDEELLKLLLEYNKDDVKVLPYILKKLTKIPHFKIEEEYDHTKTLEKLPKQLAEEILTFQRLKNEGYTAQEIANTYNRSTSYVYKRLDPRYWPKK